ncbi:recombinase family protein [Sphingomonas sp. LY54]|uniref:recombinase family protein n=1 Tax=Sphingomonas sp. LY54 TaxID=3095343 RepID=UPI002D785661|nr:recombinase family protein [Sphingomonas sp. LY54]WRP28172.1 recombinase family protein [Sphingomonas sp. LY54]
MLVRSFCKDENMCRVVAYYRVSTEAQGRSGLGLQAQREAVAGLCRQRGWEIVAEFTEVESGRRNDRPQLLAALKRGKVTGARLVIAKLDRLSRNVAFLAALQESGAKFTAADMPEADEFTVHILAAVAQRERKLISDRTKAALTAAKSRGGEAREPQWYCCHQAGRKRARKRPSRPSGRTLPYALRSMLRLLPMYALQAHSLSPLLPTN